MRAKTEIRKTEIYTMDLVWLLAKAEMIRYGPFEAPMPSEIEWKTATKDTRSAKQIQDSLLKRLKEI